MKLSTDEVADRLERLTRWSKEGETIQRRYRFDNFASAIAFIVRVGFDAEAADHHPDVLLSGYRYVTLTFTTHSAGALTEKDFAGALAADRVYGVKE